jgi:hypothetical protein
MSGWGVEYFVCLFMAGGAPRGLVAYDMRPVDFSKAGTYECSVQLANGKTVYSTIRVDADMVGHTGGFFLGNANGPIDADTFCTERSSNGLRWFSDVVFNQNLGEPKAIDRSFVEFQ